ncbi:MAG: aspartyl-tRNA synthetase [Candidatus Xenolissoclinum pacificiensis L6]|uniref:Aspartyl-tRNA synthetase n=1 Tax=Candidatus Xenolissoclinum pacificiensis L6 TaxID=1401685 RepID=W2V255_9RICK|nr:MAG: aspartyl-tRNA synthetase [Candidatus Xenolissoclinum pacificiensis L6]
MDFRHKENNVASASYEYYHQGLRSYLVKVYKYMAFALGITGITAYMTASSQGLMSLIYGTPLTWVIMFAPLVFVFFFTAKIHSMNFKTAQMVLGLFAVVMGLSLSWIFISYTGNSITRVFFISASMFGGMALYGNTTHRDLTAFGSFLMMGVIGLVVASLLNIFMQSNAILFATSVLGVIVFSGLTAYDAKTIKDQYYRLGGNNESNVDFLNKIAIMSSLRLYFDFINIFMSLLHLMGSSNRN